MIQVFESRQRQDDFLVFRTPDRLRVPAVQWVTWAASAMINIQCVNLSTLSSTEVNELSCTFHSPSSFIAFVFLLSYTFCEAYRVFSLYFCLYYRVQERDLGNLRKLVYTSSSRQYHTF